MKRFGLWPAVLLLAGSGLFETLHAQEAVVARQHFADDNCPFTFDLPGGAVATKDKARGTEANGVRTIVAFFETSDTSLGVVCGLLPGYQAPDPSNHVVCGQGNPNLVEGSTCGRAKRYDGVESISPKTGPSDDVSFFVIYRGHKQGKGQLGYRVATKQKNPGSAEKARIEELARSLFETIR